MDEAEVYRLMLPDSARAGEALIVSDCNHVRSRAPEDRHHYAPLRRKAQRGGVFARIKIDYGDVDECMRAGGVQREALWRRDWR